MSETEHTPQLPTKNADFASEAVACPCTCGECQPEEGAGTLIHSRMAWADRFQEETGMPFPMLCGKVITKRNRVPMSAAKGRRCRRCEQVRLELDMWCSQ